MNLFLKRQMEFHLNGIFSKFLPRWAKDWAWFRLRNSAGISSGVFNHIQFGMSSWNLKDPKMGEPAVPTHWLTLMGHLLRVLLQCRKLEIELEKQWNISTVSHFLYLKVLVVEWTYESYRTGISQMILENWSELKVTNAAT